MPEEKLPRVLVGELKILLRKYRLYVFFRYIEIHEIGSLCPKTLCSQGRSVQRSPSRTRAPRLQDHAANET